MKNSSKEKTSKPDLVEKFGFFRSGITTLIRIYQVFLSTIFANLNGGGCRFFPTCSEYGLFCFRFLPLYRAFYLTIFRILRCNPYNQGGFDEPPKWKNYSLHTNSHFNIKPK